MPDLDTNLPSIRQIQSLIKEKKEVELKVVTGDLIAGKIFWQDSECLSVLDHYDRQTVIWKHAIVFIQPKA
ncbi:RNA chaperone Hfq [Oxynema sp. CENA135]|jgi:host factor-I protein|nr:MULTISPECIES: RNA chaperone Hfq [Oxynema]MBK4728421.1 RNA chaperone Hfq [Oxynema sp. CENA135]